MFDPVVEKQLLPQSEYPASYWHQDTSADEIASDKTQTLGADLRTDVLIVGGGFTGLSCAYHLAHKHNIEATIIDAGPSGWGCSGRNAGFVLNGTGRLSLAQIEQKFGVSSADAVYQQYRQGIDNVSALIAKADINCDVSHGGYLKLAHNPQAQQQLKHQLEYLQRRYDDPSQWLSDSEVQQQFLHTKLHHGAQYVPYCFALNPLKLVSAYTKLCDQLAVKRFQKTAMLDNQSDSNGHTVTTTGGTIRAKHLVMATNGYTVNKLHAEIDQRHFPVLSSVLVTAPLTEQQLHASGLKPGLMAMDTRELKYYYRLLPDNRILFGGRGAIKGKNANRPYYQQQLTRGLYQTLPALTGIAVDYFWSGWISVALDDYPRIYSTQDTAAPVHYAMGYCGSGVSFTHQAGYHLANAVMGNISTELPHLRSPLPRFPFSPFKRLGLWGFYHWANCKDKWG